MSAGDRKRWTTPRRARPVLSVTLAPYVRAALRAAATAQRVTESELVERALLRELGLPREGGEGE